VAYCATGAVTSKGRCSTEMTSRYEFSVVAVLAGKPMSQEWLDSVRETVRKQFKGRHMMNIYVRRNGRDELYEGEWVHEALNHLLEHAQPKMDPAAAAVNPPPA